MRGQVSELRFSSKEWPVPNQILQAFVLPMPSVAEDSNFVLARDFANERLASTTVE